MAIIEPANKNLYPSCSSLSEVDEHAFSLIDGDISLNAVIINFLPLSLEVDSFATCLSMNLKASNVACV